MAKLLGSILLILNLIPQAHAADYCAVQLQHAIFLAQYREAEVQAGRESQVEALRAQGQLIDWRRACELLTEAQYQNERLANLAAIRASLVGEVAAGKRAPAELLAHDSLAIDFRWKQVLVSTLEYCREKFQLLDAGRLDAIARSVRPGAYRSERLEVELAIQRHRELCELEASISLPEPTAPAMPSAASPAGRSGPSSNPLLLP